MEVLTFLIKDKYYATVVDRRYKEVKGKSVTGRVLLFAREGIPRNHHMSIRAAEGEHAATR